MAALACATKLEGKPINRVFAHKNLMPFDTMTEDAPGPST